MALSPEIEPFMDDEELEVEEIMTSETFGVNFETGRIASKAISGLQAIEQFVQLAIRTPRFSFAVFSDDFGCEVEELLIGGGSAQYNESEIERMITEALIYDERIDSVTEFNVQIKNDGLYVNFKVNTAEGSLEMEEVIGGET